MRDDLDALRRSYDEEESFLEDEPEIDFEPRSQEEKRFLGMTAVERMFLSIFLFLNVVVLGAALLLATNRIVF